MADYSYQGLVGAPVQQPPQSLWNGLQAPQAPNVDPSMLAMMLAKQRQMQDPQSRMPELNPGQTWGGRDRNAIQPDDATQSRFFPQMPDSI